MKTKFVVAWAALCCFPSLSLAVPTTYSYTGHPYAIIENTTPPEDAYTTSMSLSGSITLVTALSPFSNVFVDSSLIVSMDFFDGRLHYTKDNTDFVQSSIVLGTTDLSANITTWAVALLRIDTAPPGVVQSDVQSFNCGAGGGCDVVTQHVTDTLRDRATSNLRGSWTTTPIPEPSTYVLFLVGVGLVGLAARRRFGQRYFNS